MNASKVGAVVLLSIVSLYLAFLTGEATAQRRAQVNANLCLTDKAIVNVFVESFTRYWTPTKIQLDPKRYERSRTDTLYYVRTFEKIAPCEITATIPKDYFKP